MLKSPIKLGLFFEKSHDRLPTELILIDLLHEYFECSTFDASKLYDKGYVDAFISEHDILLPHLFSIRAASLSKKWGDYRYYTPNYRELITKGARVLEILKDTQKPICCFNIRSDWYPETRAFWECIPQNAYIFGGMQKGYINPHPLEREFFFDDMEINPTLGNEYFDDDKIIPIRHVLSNDELTPRRINKRYDLSVLGVFYARRKFVYEQAKTFKIKLYRAWLLHRLRKALNRHHKRSYWSNRLLNALFNDALRRSRISYTDGSHLDMFVRKYLEIPANHSLLLCAPLMRMEDYGFIENVNYIRCDMQHLQQQLNDILAHQSRYNSIVQAGFDMVCAHYNPQKVASQLQTIFSQIANHSFKGCYYDKGELCLGTRDA